MVNGDRGRFTALVQALAATFRAEPTKALFEGYWLGLRDLDIDRVEMAAARAIASCARMPVPVELRALAGESTATVRAVQAWEAAIRALRRFGSYKSVNFEDKTINATIRVLGGWERFCLTESDELHKWVRRDFERTYLALSESGVSEEASRYLMGTFERENTANGTLEEAVRMGLLPAKPVQVTVGGQRAIEATQEMRAIEGAK